MHILRVDSHLDQFKTLAPILSPGALTYAELGTLITESGAEWAYIKESFGQIPSFLYAWMSMLLLKPASAAIIALTCAEYVMVPLFDDDCGIPPEMLTKLTAAVVICKFINHK